MLEHALTTRHQVTRRPTAPTRANDDLPDEFLCAITHDIMEDPVICVDGHTYDRVAIEKWLQNHNTGPKTNAVLRNHPNPYTTDKIYHII